MKKATLSLLLILLLTGCEYSASIGDEVIIDSDFEKLSTIAEELNNCLATSDDVSTCNNYIAIDTGSISGTDTVRAILPDFPPYMRALKNIDWNEPKSMVATEGEKVYVLTGIATLDNNGTDLNMYVRYNFVDQAGIKIYGVQYDPNNKLEAEF